MGLWRVDGLVELPVKPNRDAGCKAPSLWGTAVLHCFIILASGELSPFWAPPSAGCVLEGSEDFSGVQGLISPPRVHGDFISIVRKSGCLHALLLLYNPTVLCLFSYKLKL